LSIGTKPDDDGPDDVSGGGCGFRLSRRAAMIGGAGIASALPSSGWSFAPPLNTGSQIFESNLHGRSAWTITNDRLRISVLNGGGFIGELSLVAPEHGAPFNVMRVPHYPTIDPDTFDLARDAPRYGDGMQRKLMSGYMGHFVTFPHFGGSSESEFAADYAQHGEAVATRWKREQNSPADTLVMHTHLPLTRYDFCRSIELPPNQPVAYVTETATSLTSFDRPYQWVQHITFGPPFVERGRNHLDMSPATLIDRTPKDGAASGFALGGISNPPAIPFTGETQAWAMAGDRAEIYVAVHNPSMGVLVGYIFETDTSRWLLDWQEYRRNQGLPWSGQGVARGICIGNSIIGGLRAAVGQGTLGGVPTFGWFNAKGSLSRHYTIFAISVGDDFQGVADVQYGANSIGVTERGPRRKIHIPHRGAGSQRPSGVQAPATGSGRSGTGGHEQHAQPHRGGDAG